MLPGTTGASTDAGATQAGQPGVGLGGGLSGGTAMGSAPAASGATVGGSGSANMTSGSAVGQRP